MIIEIITSLSTAGQIGGAVALAILAIYLRRVVGIVAILSNVISIVAIVIGVFAVATLLGWIDPNLSGVVDDLGAISDLISALRELIL